LKSEYEKFNGNDKRSSVNVPSEIEQAQLCSVFEFNYRIGKIYEENVDYLRSFPLFIHNSKILSRVEFPILERPVQSQTFPEFRQRNEAITILGFLLWD
jgi:hypothetical protein